jgi:signal peptidase I
MQDQRTRYTSRDEVELLLKQTMESGDKKKNAPPDKKKKTVWNHFRHILFSALILALLVALGTIWIQRIKGETPNLLGFQLYVVETGSMEPTLPVGSTILVRALGSNETPKVGDVITYNHLTAAVTHRIVSIATGDDGVTRYQTKGDNPENSEDPWLVNLEEIRGVMIWHFAW